MTVPRQRSEYLAAQIQAIHHNLRFLETVVTSPIGLTTDLQSLRESMAVAGAAVERDRTAFQDVARAKNAKTLGFDARRIASETMDLVVALGAEGQPGLPPEWRSRAAKVLERIDARLGAEIRQSRARELRGLYVIVDPEQTNGRPVLDVAAAALEGGAVAIQLRDKKSDKGLVLQQANALVKLCGSKQALFIANDDADVARLAHADGLHVGQTDLPVAAARQILAPDQLIGSSNALFEEAIASESQAADYIAVGRIYETETKSNTRPAGLDTLRRVKHAVGVPVVAIGGINETNVVPVVRAGADAICVISAVCRAPDPKAAAARLAELIESNRPR
ncbi:MAG: thiamine phosphate synthase [Chloroflexi bacterium]|nr:thiamine phosphate synthase [Chloroflexota bacterium]